MNVGMEDKTVPAVALGEVGEFAVPPAVASMAVPVGKIHMLSYRISDEGGGVTCTNR